MPEAQGEFELAAPTREEAALAFQASNRLRPFVHKDKPLRITAEDHGATAVEVPAVAAVLLMRLLQEMARGNAVTLIPIHAELSTQKAADFLGVSRPFLVKLLESGKIPFHTVGTHRRVRFKDLMAFKRESDRQRERALQEMADDAQESGLGY